MRRLSRDEKDIHRSAGIDAARFWPFMVMFVSDFVMSTNTPLFERCLGNPLASPAHGIWGGRAVAAVREVLAIPCSFYRPGGDALYWTSIALFVLAIPFAVMQFLWMRRHRVYWDAVRKKEATKRSERRAQKALERTKVD
jgi:hypothetical protein